MMAARWSETLIKIPRNLPEIEGREFIAEILKRINSGD